MVNIRCRGYDDSGNPVGRGCSRGRSCLFVHPDDRRWDSAIRKHQGASGPSGPSRFARDRNERRSSNLWDPDAPDPPATSSNATILPDSGGRRNSYGSDRNKDGSDQSSHASVWSSAWDNVVTKSPLTDKKQDDQRSGWSTGDGWGSPAAKSSGWGNSTPSNNASTGDGWGSPTAKSSGWGNLTTNNNTSSWGGSWASGSGSAGQSASADNKLLAGETASSESWGSGNGAIGSGMAFATADDKKAESRKGKEKATDMLPHSSSWGQPPPAIPPAGRPSRLDLPRLQPDAPPLPYTQSPIATTSPSVSKPTDASRHDKASFSSVDLKTTAIDRDFKVPHPGAMALLKEFNNNSRSSTPTTVGVSTREYRGSKGRAALYKDIVKKMQHAALLQIQSQRAEEDLERWKRTQISERYRLCPTAARKLLDAERAKYTARDADLKKRLLRSVQELADLPDLTEKHKPLGMTLTKEGVAVYTRELGEWFNDLQLHKRLLMDEAQEHEALPEGDEDPEEEEPEDLRVPAAELRARGKWSWSELIEAVSRIEDQLNLVSEEVYAARFTNVEDEIDAEMEQVKEQITSEEAVVKPAHNYATTNNLQARTNTVGDKLSVQTDRAVDLIQRGERINEQLKLVVAETTKMNQVCQEAEQQFVEFECWKESDMARIQELTAQLQKLHLHKRVNDSSSPPRFPPVKLEVLLEYVKPTLLERMHKDLAPIFQALRDRCIENQDRAKAEIDDMVKPALRQTDDICQRVLSLSVGEASAQLS